MTPIKLLDEAAGQSKRDIERLVARRFPKPDVPTSIRRRPARRVARAAAAAEAAPAKASQETPAPEPSAAQVAAPETPVLELTPPEPTPARVEPLSEATYKVSFTAPKSLVDTLREVQALASHAVPDGTFYTSAEFFERGLELLRVKLLKQRFGADAASAEASEAEQAPEPACAADQEQSRGQRPARPCEQAPRGAPVTSRPPSGRRCGSGTAAGVRLSITHVRRC